MQKRLLSVAQGQKTDRIPIWLMRQAGRYLKGYQRIRSKYSFLEVCKNPQLCTKVSLEPYQKFGVDGVIVFSDIMIPAEAMGIKINFNPGPILEKPLESEKEIQRLKIADPHEKTPFVLDALRMIKSEISNETTLIGFAGGPFTTASYLIEGKHVDGFPALKQFMKKMPKLFHELLEKLTETILQYLKANIKAGADLVQVFDSATYLLSRKEYLEFAYPYEKKLINSLKGFSPVILFLRDTEKFIDEIKKSGASVISVDAGMELGEARKILGEDVVLQGNLDPGILQKGSREDIRNATLDILHATGGKKHIFNLGHGVLKDTPIDHVSHLVEVVQNYV